MKHLLILSLALLAFAACHRDSEAELQADAFSAKIVSAFQSGDTKEAERQVKAMNDYARALPDDSLKLFMLRYETHAQEIAAAAAQGIQGAMQHATRELGGEEQSNTTLPIQNSNPLP